MALSIFDDRNKPPQPADLAQALGELYPLWTGLIQTLQAQIPGLAEVWGFSGKSSGWGLRLKRGERVILYLTPCAGHFLVSFALGEKAVQAAQAAGLPAPILAAIAAAPRYAEGRGVRLDIHTAGDLDGVAALAGCKLAN